MLLAPEGRKGGVWGRREPGSGGQENRDQSHGVSFHSFNKLLFFSNGVGQFLTQSLDSQITLQMDVNKIFKAI